MGGKTTWQAMTWKISVGAGRRPDIVEEIVLAPDDVGTYIRSEIANFLRLHNLWMLYLAISCLITPAQARLPNFVSRLKNIATLA